MSDSNFPDAILIKVILSLCFLFIFACILNTNAEKSFLIGLIIPSVEFLPNGDEVISRKYFKNISTPKLVRADPKNTGVCLPRWTKSRSSEDVAPSSSSISSSNLS